MASQSQDKDKNSDILKWASKDGEFNRQVSSFREVIQDGSKFAPEKGRYYLYVSLACEFIVLEEKRREMLADRVDGSASFWVG